MLLRKRDQGSKNDNSLLANPPLTQKSSLINCTPQHHA